MCGIAAIININNPSYLSTPIQLMTNSLIKRGPDDEGYVLFENKPTIFYGNSSVNKNTLHIENASNFKSKIAFGFRRLKILDLSEKGHQPMSDESKNYWIIFNGEIYNYKEIREELKKLGHTFFSSSDTEVVLKAYMVWKEKCLDKFNGMFAFSIFDVKQNDIFIARDRIGMKPLYYLEQNNQFIIASTIKSIIDSGLYKPEVNWEGLWQNYTFSIAQRPNTSFLNIYALEPGHYIKLDLNSCSKKIFQYWDIPTGIQDFSLTEKKAADLLEEALFKSIKYQLNADVEVGSFMSGGIDSTLITAMASKINPSIKAFTLAYAKKYKEFNENEEASSTAKLNNINHLISCVDPVSIIDNLSDIVLAYEEPYHHLAPNFSLSKIVAENNIKVVLNGLGGDELFAGYDVYKKVRLWRLLRNFSSISSIIPKGINQKLDKVKLLSSYNNIAQFYTHYYTTFSDFDNSRLFKNKKFDSLNTLEQLYLKPGIQFTDEIEALSYLNLKSYIGNHHCRTIDQFTMNFSIEGRFPFLDHELIELAFKIPSKYKIKNNNQKYILKEVAKKYISPNSLNMKKKGLSSPLNKWHNNELKNIIAENIHQLKKRNIFNNEEIDRIVKTSNNESKIWQLVMTEMWFQNFFK